ncbi:hypothetical protein P8452_65234 [Trifolium repens]|nr:hypothetical protein P8452_65234 [Trifolium repens]
MAASSSSSRNVTIYAVDDAEPIIVDGSTFVSEPDMTSVEDTIWGEELMIPHKLRGRTLAFAGPLPSSDNFNEDNSDEVLLQAIETGFAALQQRTPKGKGASKAKGATTSTDTTTPEIEKETENSVSDPPVEDQPSTHVETPSTEGPILEKVNPNLQDPGTQGDNEEQPTAPFNNDEGHTKENNECHEAGGSNPCSRCISREG